jgi:hypothetical protein
MMIQIIVIRPTGSNLRCVPHKRGNQSHSLPNVVCLTSTSVDGNSCLVKSLCLRMSTCHEQLGRPHLSLEARVDVAGETKVCLRLRMDVGDDPRAARGSPLAKLLIWSSAYVGLVPSGSHTFTGLPLA